MSDRKQNAPKRVTVSPGVQLMPNGRYHVRAQHPSGSGQYTVGTFDTLSEAVEVRARASAWYVARPRVKGYPVPSHPWFDSASTPAPAFDLPVFVVTPRAPWYRRVWSLMTRPVSFL